MALTEEEEDELRRLDLEQKRLEVERQRLEVKKLRKPPAPQKGCHSDFQTCLGTIIIIIAIILFASCPSCRGSGGGYDPWIPPSTSSE